MRSSPSAATSACSSVERMATSAPREAGSRGVAMLPGSLWYLRLSEPHAAANRGTTDRVHLVVDVRANDWLLALLGAGVA